jgi:predicted RNase H-like nuclease
MNLTWLDTPDEPHHLLTLPEHAAMPITVIGIDCAVNPANVGLALGHFANGSVRVQKIVRGSSEPDLPGIIARWLYERLTGPALLALDAPLGWPAPLARALPDHRAGNVLHPQADELFRRTTDEFVHKRIGKRPLDVGADRIARTARAALALLHELRQRLDNPIPLAWQPDFDGIAAIEVYPAATLMAHHIPAHAYKHARGAEDRQNIMNALQAEDRLEFELEDPQAPRTSDEVDAVVCLLAAQDFLRGQTLPLPDRALAEKEGWIWVRDPSHGS